MTHDALEPDIGQMLAAFDASQALYDEISKNRRTMKALYADLVQVIDGVADIEREAAKTPDNPAVMALARSTGIVLKRLSMLLAERGVTQIGTTGCPLDLDRHRVVETRVARGYAEPTVLEEVRRGYLWDGQVLRPAEVVVSKLADVDDEIV